MEVRVPSMLRDLVPWYLTHSTETLFEMERAVAAQDFASVQLAAHGLKGSGGSYGMSHLTELAAAVENAARSSDTARMSKGIAAMKEYLASVDLVFDP